MTWKPKDWKECLIIVGGSISKGDMDSVVHMIEQEISSSQALARREGIEEAMRVVEGMKGRKKFADDWEAEGWLQAIRHIEQALQEKLDTKGV